MGRSTVYNDNLTQNYDQVSEDNKQLIQEFINYCKANDRSDQTVKQYTAQLKIFFCWNHDNNKDIFFIDLKKRDFIKFFGWLRNLGVSSNRVASFKAVLSSFSNSIELLDDDLYPNFRNLVKNLETVHKAPVREKTVLSDEQVQNCLDKLVEDKQYQLACCVAVLASSGMRKSELLQMKDSFFVPTNIVLNCLYKTPNIRQKGRGVQGKQDGRYCICEPLNNYLNLWRAKREELGITIDDLFVVRKNGSWVPATTATINSWMSRIEEILGVPMYAHAMRHYVATRLSNMEGMTKEAVQALFGWASLDMVDRYDDTPKEDKLAQYFTPERLGITKGE